MKTYVVVYKSPDGQIRDRYVTARNHRKAMESVSRENLEVVSVDRADNEGSSRLVGNPRRSAVVALIIGIVTAAVVISLFWLWKGCPRLF